MAYPNEDDEQALDGSNGNTRRQFMAGSAGAVGGLALGGALVGSSVAQEDEEEGDEEDFDDDEEEAELVEDEFDDDVDILNYALTLEYLEARFYEQGLDNIGEEGLCNCEVLAEDSALGERVYDELRTIQQHEESHVETLRGTIEDLGGEPIDEPEFDFGLAVEYPMAFLGTAAELEDVGVSAYAGAAPHIENEDLIPPALGIHSVEARHASFLRTLLNETGFPDTIDEARSRSEVEGIATEYIVDMDEMPDDDDEDDDEEMDEEDADDEDHDDDDWMDDDEEMDDDDEDYDDDNGWDDEDHDDENGLDDDGLDDNGGLNETEENDD